MTPEQFELFARIEQEHWWFVARREIVRQLLARVLAPDGTKTVVDLGCGTGGNIAALSAGYRCTGIDESALAIGYANARFQGVEFVRTSDAAEVSGRLGGADAVLCMDVVEHVEDDASFVADIVHATRPGTQILFTVPADMALWSAHDETNHHFRRYTAGGFAALYETLPVRVRLLSAFNSRLYPMVRAARAVGRVRKRAHGDAGTDFKTPSYVVNRVLERVFRGELIPLIDAIDTARQPYRRGVSVIAMLERTAG